MDYIKNVLIALIVLSLVTIASAQYTTDGYGHKTLDYATLRMVGLGVYIPNGTTKEIYTRANNHLEPSKVILEVIPYNEAGLITTNLTINCSNINTTVNLSSYDTWLDSDVAYIEIPTIYPYETTIRPSSDNVTAEGQVCGLTPGGQALFITSYLLPQDFIEQPSISDNYDFSTPNQPLANIVGIDGETGIRGLLNSGFVLLNMMIMIMAFIFFVTIIVIFYKILQYFASRPKAIETK